MGSLWISIIGIPYSRNSLLRSPLGFLMDPRGSNHRSARDSKKGTVRALGIQQVYDRGSTGIPNMNEFLRDSLGFLRIPQEFLVIP